MRDRERSPHSLPAQSRVLPAQPVEARGGDWRSQLGTWFGGTSASGSRIEERWGRQLLEANLGVGVVGRDTPAGGERPAPEFVGLGKLGDICLLWGGHPVGLTVSLLQVAFGVPQPRSAGPCGPHTPSTPFPSPPNPLSAPTTHRRMELRSLHPLQARGAAGLCISQKGNSQARGPFGAGGCLGELVVGEAKGFSQFVFFPWICLAQSGPRPGRHQWISK